MVERRGGIRTKMGREGRKERVEKEEWGEGREKK